MEQKKDTLSSVLKLRKFWGWGGQAVTWIHLSDWHESIWQAGVIHINTGLRWNPISVSLRYSYFIILHALPLHVRIKEQVFLHRILLKSHLLPILPHNMWCQIVKSRDNYQLLRKITFLFECIQEAHCFPRSISKVLAKITQSYCTIRTAVNSNLTKKDHKINWEIKKKNGKCINEVI